MEKDNIIDVIERVFHDTGLDYKVRFTSKAGHALTICAEEIEMGANTIIAVGGDGTVNEIAGALKDTDIVMGIIPSGSGN
ncbi:MAG: acylglycerol kinase family protein, partial [Candidatus Electryoneaceae bacterium]|nr:acylglycerol kinase family protein [Candidatus Electryoneaceae bacterium]